MGIEFGGESSKSKQSSTSQGSEYQWGTDYSQDQYSKDPWGQQAPYLTDMFQRAQAMLGTQNFNTQERDSAWRGYDWSQGQADNLRAAESALMGKWDDVYNRQVAEAGRYSRLANDIADTTVGDIRNQATDFAENNPYIDQAIEQSWTGVNKLLDRNVGGVGGINHAAGASGNMSSSRAGVAEGLARSEMADYGQENELGLRKSVFDQGVGVATDLLGNKVSLAGQMAPYAHAGVAGNILAGMQNTQAGYDDLLNRNYLAQMGFASGLPYGSQDQNASWNQMLQAWDVIGRNNWGGSGTSTSTSEMERKGTSTNQSSAKGSSKGFGFDTSFNL